MNKEKEIQEIAQVMDESCGDTCVSCEYQEDCLELAYAKKLYNAGYRKADEVREETASEIIKKLYEQILLHDPDEKLWKFWKKDFLDIAIQYGVEVDE